MGKTVKSIKEERWLPISTAPKDGTVIDIWSPDYGRLPYYRYEERSLKNAFYSPAISGTCCIRNATHWMPLPEPPSEYAEYTEIKLKYELDSGLL